MWSVTYMSSWYNNVVYQGLVVLLTMSSWYNNVVYQSVISRMLLTMSSWYNNVVYQSVRCHLGTIMWYYQSVISRVTYHVILVQ